MLVDMKTLLIVYHSMTGGTHQLAQAAAAGAEAEELPCRPDCSARSMPGPKTCSRRDAYVFATPENLASMSGLMKDFFDRNYYAALDRINGRRMPH
jgi:multimeric flavodoxin WrbA